MDTLISALADKIDQLELATIKECVAEKSNVAAYRINGHASTTLMLDPNIPYSAEHIIKTLNTYLWNNSLLCGNKIIRLNEPLKQALHYYEPTIHYSELIVKLVEQFELQ